MSELKVAAATLSEPEDVVVFGTSAALAVVTGYAPASGGDRGSVTTRIYGARVYVHEAATAGNIYCFNPRAFRVFSSRLRSASVIDPTTGGTSLASGCIRLRPGWAGSAARPASML